MDAFSVAFRIPNLSRRVFGEGALTAAFLPVFIRERQQRGEQSGWQLASGVLLLLLLTLSALVVIGELILLLLNAALEPGSNARLLTGLTAVMLPYLVLICLAAQFSAILHALNHFTWPALIPVVLNVVWIAAIWWVAPHFATAQGQVYVVAGAVVVGGILQCAVAVPALFRSGFRFDVAWMRAHEIEDDAIGGRIREILRTLVPVVAGLSLTQFNSLLDALMAWGFAAPEIPDGRGSGWYPIESGTASALYLGQRMYQFPLGVFGIALGTVLFPILTRHAEDGRMDRLRDDLTLGLKLVIGIGLPAGVGLVVLAEPLTDLLFRYGRFDARDARQTSAMIAVYGSAVWAWCGLLILYRAFYSVRNQRTPMRLGLISIVVNLLLSVTLIWFVGGVGLAIGTAIAATIQGLLAVRLIQNSVGRLEIAGLIRFLLRCAIAAAVMTAVCLLVLRGCPAGDAFSARLLRLVLPVLAGAATYFAAGYVLGLKELLVLFGRTQHGR